MTQPATTPTRFIGADVGKAEIVFYDRSGNTHHTIGGRPEIKQALFLPAQTAARFNPVLKDTYKRVIDAGKKPILAIVAITLRDACAEEEKMALAANAN